jgi:hypothetical protein
MAYVGTAKDLGDERKTLASVLEGEAGGEGLSGMRAVASVIQNRTNRNFSGYGKDYTSQVTAKKQFQGQSTPSKAAYRVADELLKGTLQNVVPNALYYANPEASTAGWAKRLDESNAVKIGSHYYTDNTRGKAFTASTPAPVDKPTAVAQAQAAPQNAMDAISGMLGSGASVSAPALSYAPSVDQIASQANRVAANLPNDRFTIDGSRFNFDEDGIPIPRDTWTPPNLSPPPISIPGVSQPGMSTPTNQSLANPFVYNRDRMSPINIPIPRVEAGVTAQPMPSPAPARPGVVGKEMANVSIPPTSYRVDLDKAIDYARDTGQLTGIPALLPNSALYGAAQTEIAKSAPPGTTYDPKTNTINVQDRGLLTNPPVDPTTNKTANYQDYIDRGIATPMNGGTTETMPLPVPRPQRSSEPQYPDISSWDVFKNPVPMVLPRQPDPRNVQRQEQQAQRAPYVAPVPKQAPRPAPQQLRSIVPPKQASVDTSSLAGILKASNFPAEPTVPYAEGTYLANKDNARLQEGVPGMAFAGDQMTSIPAVAAIDGLAPPLPLQRPRIAPLPAVPKIPQVALAPYPAQMMPRRAPSLFGVTLRDVLGFGETMKAPVQRQPQNLLAMQMPTNQTPAYQSLRGYEGTSDRSNDAVRQAAASVNARGLTETQARSLLYSGAYD